ncbi:MAG: N-acetylmuramoyl-L-alanine amidase [Actinomycetia bacterium]|nr:N-acetylmuramoyl-L-alanine amidase [Actinomycetes bacterium]
MTSERPPENNHPVDNASVGRSESQGSRGERQSLQGRLTSRRAFLLGALALALPASAIASSIVSSARSAWRLRGVPKARVTTREESLTAGRVLEARMVVLPVREAPPFTMVGLHWQGSGELWFRAAGADLPLGPWVRAECCERPDDDSNEAGLPDWHLGKPAWTGPATCIQYRYRGEISALRAHFVYSEPVADRRISATGAPAIIARSGWVANEELVRAEPLVAERLRLAMLHHTAGGVPVTPQESAAIIRGIQVYHVEANGWDDIGYNFLVDPFGQVFEGRAGGIERNVVGAHAQGFNTGSVGIAVLGYYQQQGITPEARAALINLLAWRLDVAHVDPQTLPSVLSRGSARYPSHVPVIMRAVSGHRDIDLTTCPGDHLYAELNTLAAHASFVDLPKLYEPRVEGTLGGPVRFTARLSQELWWNVVVTDELGTTMERGEGVGAGVDWTWDASGISGGPYNYTIGAGDGVRPATGTVGAPPPPPPPPAPPPPRRPAGIPRRIPKWAWKMHKWHNRLGGQRGRRPAAPRRLPRWYWTWRRWQLELAHYRSQYPLE